MSIFGVLLLVIILLVFSFILLSDYIYNNISRSTSIPQSFRDKISDLCNHCTLHSVQKNAGTIALLLGIWNLFGPNFGSLYGGLPIIGALIPSLVLCFDAFILNPDLLHWRPLESSKEYIEHCVSKYSPLAGWITLATAILHSLLYPLPFF